MQHKKKYGLALAVAAAVAAPSAFATTGYFSHGYSMKEKGMAGTGVAYAQDALAAANNPAGMVMVGNRMDIGLALFSPIREYEVSGGPAIPAGVDCPNFGVGPCPISLTPGTVESENDYFLIPSFGWNKMLDADSSVGVSVYANGGMNTRYKDGSALLPLPPTGTMTTVPGTFGGGFFGGKTTGVDLAQVFVNVSYAQKLAPNASWGVSGILAYQQFEARGLGAFGAFGLSQDPTKLSDNGHDKSTGFGAKIGVMGEVVPGVSLGGQYQTKMSMSEFDDYKGLFAQGGDFDIPATATLGLAWKATPTSVLTFDVQQIWYSDVDSVGNTFNPAFNQCFGGVLMGVPASSNSNCLGGNRGPGFGWEDINVYRLGYQWTTDAEWTWRVGFILNDQPIQDDEVLFNILAPAVQEQHFTFGFTRQMDKNSELTFAAMYSPEEEVKGTNPLDPTQTITLRMHQYEVGAAWGWKF
jgi:long-chain fatty acid transport protein